MVLTSGGRLFPFEKFLVLLGNGGVLPQKRYPFLGELLGRFGGRFERRLRGLSFLWRNEVPPVVEVLLVCLRISVDGMNISRASPAASFQFSEPKEAGVLLGERYQVPVAGEQDGVWSLVIDGSGR